MDQQHPSWRKYPSVNAVAEGCPDTGDQKLAQGCKHKIIDRHQPVSHQRDLKICNHIDNDYGKQLGEKNIHRLQVPHLQPSIGIRKEKKQHQINPKHQ